MEFPSESISTKSKYLQKILRRYIILKSLDMKVLQLQSLYKVVNICELDKDYLTRYLVSLEQISYGVGYTKLCLPNEPVYGYRFIPYNYLSCKLPLSYYPRDYRATWAVLPVDEILDLMV